MSDVLGTSGPIPDTYGQVPTVFGQINSVLQQTANTAIQIRETLNQYQGRTTAQPAIPHVLTSSEKAGIFAIVAVLGVVVWFALKE